MPLGPSFQLNEELINGIKFSWWNSFVKIWILSFQVQMSHLMKKSRKMITSKAEVNKHADQIINFQTISTVLYESWVKSRPWSRKETFIEEPYLAAFVSLSVIISSSGFQYVQIIYHYWLPNYSFYGYKFRFFFFARNQVFDLIESID